MWLEAIVLREKADVWCKVAIADHEVEHAATFFPGMSAGERHIEGDNNSTDVPAPAALRNDLWRMVEIPNDDPWEFGSRNECNHLFNPLLVWSILGTKVAVEVKGDDVQRLIFEPDLRSPVTNGSR